jgi:antitoxin VapB
LHGKSPGKSGAFRIEPIAKPTNIIELLAAWRKETPLEPQDRFPDIDDRPAKPETIF